MSERTCIRFGRRRQSGRAVQVDMLEALARKNIVPDFVIGAPAGAISAAFVRRSEAKTRLWLQQNGFHGQSTPDELLPHEHEHEYEAH